MSNHEGIWTEYRPTYADYWSACKRMGDVVRCRDCKYAKATLQGMPAERVLVCTAHLRDFPTRDDGFCHLGRRDA